MKLTVIISTMLIAQVSASFFDVFQGAMLSVQNGFEKLLSDVVTDVKDTVDCTILAVEHVLSLSEDATKLYYDKCGSGTKNGTVQPQLKEGTLPTVEISILSNEEYLKKEIPEEIDARINATLTGFLNGYNPHARLEDIEKELAKETQRLADVSEFVKIELDKLSHEIHFDFKRLVPSDSKPSIDNILEQLKMLEAIEQNLNNRSEANEVHQVIDNVLHKLNSIEYTDAAENTKVEIFLKDLENNSNTTYKVIRQQLKELQEEENIHLNLIKNKIQEHEKTPEHLNYFESHNVNNTDASTTESSYSPLPMKQFETKMNGTSDIRNVNIVLATLNTTSVNNPSTSIPISTQQISADITPTNYSTAVNDSMYMIVSYDMYGSKTNNISAVKTTQSINTIITTGITENSSSPTTEQTKTIPEKLESSTITSNDDRNTLPTATEDRDVISTLKTETVNQMNNILKIANPRELSTVQINDVSEITTPVAIITSSYVNVNSHEVVATTMVNIDSSLLTTTSTNIFLTSLSQVTNQGLLSDPFLNQTLATTTLAATTDTNMDYVSTTSLAITSPEISTQEPTTHKTEARDTESTSKNGDDDSFKLTTPLIVVKTTNSENVHIPTEHSMHKSDWDLKDGTDSSTQSEIKERTPHNEVIDDSYTFTEDSMHSTVHPQSHAQTTEIPKSTESQNEEKYGTTSAYRSTEKVYIQPTPHTTKSPMNTDWHVPPKYMPPQIKPPTFANSLDILTPHNEPLRYKGNNNPPKPMSRELPASIGYLPPLHKYPKKEPTIADMNAPITPRPIPTPAALKKSPSRGRSRHTGRTREFPPRLKSRKFRKNNEQSSPSQSYNKAIRPPDTFNQPPMKKDQTTMVTTTAARLTSPKSSILDPDFNSFFHTSTKNTETHQNAVKDARQLIEDSQRQQRIFDSIFNRKNDQNAFGLPKPLNVGE